MLPLRIASFRQSAVYRSRVFNNLPFSHRGLTRFTPSKTMESLRTLKQRFIYLDEPQFTCINLTILFFYCFKVASYYQVKTRLIIFSVHLTYIGAMPRLTLRFFAACGINVSQIQIKLRNCIIFLGKLCRYTSAYLGLPLCPESPTFKVIYLHVPRLITTKLPYIHAVSFLFSQPMATFPQRTANNYFHAIFVTITSLYFDSPKFGVS